MKGLEKQVNGEMNFSNLIIDNEYISVFASGPSVNNIPDDEIKTILDKTFSFTINYGFVKIESDVNVYQTPKIGKFIKNYSQHNVCQMYHP